MLVGARLLRLPEKSAEPVSLKQPEGLPLPMPHPSCSVSSMTPEERARRLRREADEVLELVGLRALLEPLGPIMETGSYYMDLMMYPDIDLCLPPTTPEKLLGVAMELGKIERVKKLRFLRGGSGELKDGLYIKPEIESGDWGRLWKVDIWALPEEVLAEKRREMESLKARMTPEERALVLDTKYRLLTDEGRTPMFSGIFIYRAVIDEGMRDLGSIVGYLRENGINL